MLIEGVELRIQDKLAEAKDFFISYLAEHPDNQQAYVELYYCYNKKTATEIIKYFNSLPKEASKDHLLLLAYLYLKEGDIESAKNVNNSVIAQNPNTSLSTRAKINNLYITMYNENDLQKTSDILNDVMSKPELSNAFELAQVQEAFNIYNKVPLGNVVDNSVYNEPDSDQEQANTDSQEYSLIGNFPNPFNPITAITYNLPRTSSVEITIYDILGNKVKDFVISSQSAGNQRVIWNGTNSNNQQVSSGIYIYHFKAVSLEGKHEVFEKSAKLLLVK